MQDFVITLLVICFFSGVIFFIHLKYFCGYFFISIGLGCTTAECGDIMIVWHMCFVVRFSLPLKLRKYFKDSQPSRAGNCDWRQITKYTYWHLEMSTKISRSNHAWTSQSPGRFHRSRSNRLVTGEFPSQTPVTRRFDVFFDLRLNKQLIKQSRRQWFETPSCSLWSCDWDKPHIIITLTSLWCSFQVGKFIML